MNPEDDVINPSSLTKFRKLRLKDTDLLNLLINKTVTIAIEKGIFVRSLLSLMPLILYQDLIRF